MAARAEQVRGSLTIIVADPRHGPGLLTRAAWHALEAAAAIGHDPDVAAHADALREDGLPVVDLREPGQDGPAPPGHVAWLCADPRRAAQLGERARADDPGLDARIVEGVAAPTGAHLLDLVAVMDRLRSPGGCPWDARQTHASLAPYVVEEAHELGEAITSGDRGEIADELGDVLLQVVFHARVAADDPAEPFDIDDVADRIVAKLRRRHPHVFADTDATTPEQVEANWDLVKATEKPDRVGPLDGIPRGLTPLERAAKVVSRMTRAGRADEVRAEVSRLPGDDASRLLAVTVALALAGEDPSARLRAGVRALEQRLIPSEARRQV